MIKILITLAVAGLIVAACSEGNSEPRTETYRTATLMCDIGGETQSYTFADDEKVYHNVYVSDARINVEKRSQETRSIIEDHYWTGTCYLLKTSREVVIMPVKSDS